MKLKVALDLDLMRAPPKTHDASYWKLNTSILQDSDFLSTFKLFWKDIVESIDSFSDIAHWWDDLAKPEIKRFCVIFSIERKKMRDQRKQFLLAYMKTALECKDWGEVSRTREQLNIMLKEDSMGFVVRSRFQQNAEEERASLFHAGREIKNRNNGISSLKIQGRVVSDSLAIEQEVVHFFTALLNGHHDTKLDDTGSPFTPDFSNLDEMLKDISSLDQSESIGLESNLEYDELELVVKNCPTNKSPGLDGLSYEFFKCTWTVIGQTFLSVLQCQLDRVELIKSDRMGATRLIPKVDNIPQVDELRPITLLNCDYKILAKILVLRMKPIMPKVIRSGQLCSVGKRNILFGAFKILSSMLYVNQRNRCACLLSLDFFKAYDRVSVRFLLSVMKKMGFGKVFCSWIQMLHTGAQTKFILAKLSRAINVSFSIRQGDPLAMLLYIIYIEPLLIYIERRAVGLTLFGPLGSAQSVSQCAEGYCDDLNIVTENDADLVLVDNAVSKFELLSGAILSRNKKCKILGFGRWSRRKNWPLNYVQTVSEIKVFGIFLLNSYIETIKRNWDYRYRKFEQAIYSWSSRRLDLVVQRIEVIKIFALSRIYYIASVLPLSKTTGAKFEKLMGKFIWTSSGKIMRVSIEELKLPYDRGGLALTCVHTMSKSLLLTQLLRLLRDGDLKSRRFVDYWIGEILTDIVVDLDQGSHANILPQYFQHLACIIADAKIEDMVTAANWQILTNKMIYHNQISKLPAPKVELEADFAYSCVWKRLLNASLTSEVREFLFLLVHRKIPVKERLFRIQLALDPYCDYCLGLVEASDAVCDFEHFFCSCLKVLEVWHTIHSIISQLHNTVLSNDDILSLNFSLCKYDAEITWILGAYFYYIWRWSKDRVNETVDKDQLFGFLRFKFKSEQLGSRIRLDPCVDEFLEV